MNNSFKTFASDCAKVRNKPLSQDQINRINKVFQKDEHMTFEQWLKKSTYNVTPNGVHKFMYNAMKEAYEAGRDQYSKMVSRVLSGRDDDEEKEKN